MADSTKDRLRAGLGHKSPAARKVGESNLGAAAAPPEERTVRATVDLRESVWLAMRALVSREHISNQAYLARLVEADLARREGLSD